MPKLNSIKVLEKSFDSRISSKSIDFKVNSTEQNKQIKISIDETYQLCVPIDHDCNYFLAKGILPTNIQKCQLGRITSLGIISNQTNFKVQYEGKVSYSIKNSKISRLPMTGYVTAETIAINCDNLFQNVLAILPLKNGLQEIKYNLPTYNNFALPTVNITELDPFGDPGVIEFNGNQAFRLASNSLNLLGDFSIEFWVKPTNFLPSTGLVPGFLSATILELRQDSQNNAPFNLFLEPSRTVNVEKLTNGTPLISSTINSFNMNSWNYMNISRQNGNFTVHVNSVLVISSNNVFGNLSSNIVDWYIGNFKPSPPFGFKGLVGFMSNFRVSNVVRNGTIIPNKPFPSISC